MTLQEITHNPEGQTFDRKSIKISPKDLAVLLIAFANADGGLEAIGVDDDGNIEGVDNQAEKVNSLIKTPFDFCVPNVKVSCSMMDCVDKNGNPNHILLMDVAQSQKLHANTKDEVFFRIGDMSKKMNFDERLQLLYDKGEMIYEDSAVRNARLEDIDFQAVENYIRIIGYHKSALEFLQENDQFLTKKGDENVLSVSAVLLFGKKPQNFLPRSSVRFIKYYGTEELTGAQMNVIKDVTFEGNILQLVQKSLDFVQTQIPEHTYLTKEAKFETFPAYPEFVWKELIINAITHRDYSILGTDIQIKMFDNRICVESPGNLPGIVNLDNIRHVHFSRNPHIAKFLKNYKYVREFGEGIDRIYRELSEIGSPDPDFSKTSFILRATAYMNDTRTSTEASESVSGDILDDTKNDTKNDTKTNAENDTRNPIQASESVSRDILGGDNDTKNDTKNVPISKTEALELVSKDILDDTKNETQNVPVNVTEASESVSGDIGDYVFNDRQYKLFDFLRQNVSATLLDIADYLNVDARTVKRDLQSMKEYVIHVGSTKRGYWKIIKTPKR